jgi:hypothetical protein
MRLVKLTVLLATALALGSCTGTGINDKPVFDPISGKTTLTATVTDTTQAAPTSVQFSVDGAPLAGTVKASGSTFSIDFDSATVGNGIHAVKAVGQPGSVDLLNASIFVQNTGGAAASTAPAAPAAPAALRN